VSLTKHCAMDISDIAEHYVAGEWPASHPGCFTFQGKCPYTAARVSPTICVDILVKINVTAPAGYRTRYCGLSSRSEATIHTDLSRLCIVWIVREFVIQWKDSCVSRDKFERRVSLRILMQFLGSVLKINGWWVVCVYLTQMSKPVQQNAFWKLILFQQVNQILAFYGTRPSITPHSSPLCTNWIQYTLYQHGFVLLLFPLYV
jgi:hypothetical protein